MWDQVTKESYQSPNDGEMFTSSNLSSTGRTPVGIETIQRFFDICREYNIKHLVDFCYCDGWNNLDTGADEKTILNHISQLSDIVKKNKNDIFTIKGGFIGSYGEWVEEY